MKASFNSEGSLICPEADADPEDTASEAEEEFTVSAAAEELDAAAEELVEELAAELAEELSAAVPDDDPHAARPTAITAAIATDKVFFFIDVLLLFEKD
jgi:hypothetical protein